MAQNGEAENPIVVAGAGIGGLTAALALRQAGHDVVLMDRAAELSEVGAGLQLSPNAVSVLDRLGVLEALEPYVCAPEYLRIWSGRTGQQLGRVRFGDFIRKRHGHPFWVVHRADLQRVLLERVQETAGISVRLGTEVFDLTSSPYDDLMCVYRDDTETGKLCCKALIGADGVWSKTRRIVPGHQTARFSGQVAYRATLPMDGVSERWARDSGLWLHKDSHLVHYPVRAGRELNIVGLVQEDWEDETWSARANTETLLHRFRDWPSDIRNLLTIPDTWLKWALCSVDASGPWTHGQVALVGDAAHAMLPYMAQGAAMAIEDAAVLARHLPSDVQNIASALRAFERERKPRVSRIQNIACRNASVFHYSGAGAFARDAVLRLSKPETLTARFDDIYSWTPDG
ncbi:FAD-dependent monooxygenase [Roseibium sp.]|uniref:FAD-dependent monooxygenase n=1 Tax=Roseibium sp. TaxID=1936156 RepID=UPI003D0C21A6